MKSLKELEQIKQKTLDVVNLRKERTGGTRVVVGMATCGIAAGARPGLLAFLEEVKNRNLKDVSVSQTGCIGVCRLEPMVEITRPGEDKVTYVNMSADKVKRVIAEHVVNGQVVTEYTIGAAQ